jgi:hypothetical protein
MRALQLIYEMQARRNGRRNVFFENRFVRMMADATRTPQEQNRCGHPLRHNHGIVTRPAVHSLFRVTALPYRAGEHLDQPRIHLHGRLIETKLSRCRQPSPLCDLLRRFEQPFDRSCANAIVRVANIKAHADRARDDVPGPRLRLDLADSRH